MVVLPIETVNKRGSFAVKAHSAESKVCHLATRKDLKLPWVGSATSDLLTKNYSED